MIASTRPVALVTGASSGIGEQFARRYAREGYDVVLIARSGAALQALSAELSAQHAVTADVHVADLGDADDLAALVDAILTGLPRIDHLVNSAGVAPEGDLIRADVDELRQMVDLNITALTLLTRAAIIRMSAQGAGVIVNIASTAAHQPMPHLAAYAATKSYVLRFSEAMSQENLSRGLRIFAVSPGGTDTPMNPGEAKNKRRAEQVVDTTWKALDGKKPSVVDGRANGLLAWLSVRVFPRRYGLRTAEKMMRDKA